jgi:hypothetical protein
MLLIDEVAARFIEEDDDAEILQFHVKDQTRLTGPILLWHGNIMRHGPSTDFSIGLG